MKNSTRITVGAGVLALGGLIALAPRYGFLRTCEYAGKMGMNGDHMHCYYTARAALVIGIVTSMIGVGIMLFRNPKVGSLLAVALGVAAAATLLNPVAFNPICANPDMPCNQGIKPLMIVLGIVIFATGTWFGFAGRSRKRDMATAKMSQELQG